MNAKELIADLQKQAEELRREMKKDGFEWKMTTVLQNAIKFIKELPPLAFDLGIGAMIDDRRIVVFFNDSELMDAKDSYYSGYNSKSFYSLGYHIEFSKEERSAAFYDPIGEGKYPYEEFKALDVKGSNKTKINEYLCKVALQIL
jgi:hypothetical protein